MPTKVLSTVLLLTLLAFGVVASAKDVTIITSSSTPPYVNPETGTGVVLELITRAFAVKGYGTRFMYGPNRRVVEELESKHVDGAFNGAGAQHAYLSDPVIMYTNAAFSLEQNRLTINRISDLSNRRILAFQNATYLLTPEFAAMARENASYTEVDSQESQVPMLFLGRTDVIILEKGIFAYYLNSEKLKKRIDVSKPYVMHSIFMPSPRYVAFHDSKLRDEFNDGLKAIRSSGEYKKILAKYAIEQPN